MGDSASSPRTKTIRARLAAVLRPENKASETSLRSNATPAELRRGVLSPWETLAQSVSTIAPSTTPTLTVPLVFALSGNASWLAYAIAALAVTLIALCVAQFARDSASPGSIYTYVAETLPPFFGVMTAWALLFAYAMTGASVLGGFLNYCSVFLGGYGTHGTGALLAIMGGGTAVAIAARDVKISSQLMLYIEATSVLLIVVLVGTVLWHGGLHLDPSQVHLRAGSAGSVRLGVMLALFSFVGFESATVLGDEAREPLKTIPRAVLQSAVLTGIFFVVSAYAETLALAGSLGTTAAPMRDIAARYGLPLLGPIIDAGVLVSMFACVLACVTAASRVLLLMARRGLAHRALAGVHATHATPVTGVLAVGVVVIAPTAWLAWRGAAPADIYGWLGTLSVFGFLTTYGLIAVALPIYLRRRGKLTAAGVALAVAATAATVMLLVGTVYPLPPPPFRYFPYVYLAYLACGLGWYGFRRGQST